MANKITTVLGIDDKGWGAGLKRIGTSVSEADGFVDKLKAGFKGAKDSVVQNAGLLAVGAGGAIAAFGVKAVGQFEQLGLSVGALHDASGLTTQDASRWIEAADDIGISSDTLGTLIGRMNKNLGESPEKFKAAGVEVGHLNDGTVDANATFLNTIQRLHDIKDPTQRAALGVQLLGKSWADASELIAEGGDTIKTHLASIDTEKVLSPADVQRARDFRDMVDNIKDKFQDVALTVGKELIPVIEDVVGFVGDIADGVGAIGDVGHTLTAPFAEFGHFMTGSDGPSEIIQEVLDKVAAVGTETDRESRKAQASWGDLKSIEEQTADAAAAFAVVEGKAMQDVQDDIAQTKAKWQELHDKISGEQSMIKFKQQVDDVKQAYIDAAAVAAEKGPGSPEAIKATEDARLKTLDLENTVATYGETILGLPPEKVTQLVAEIDQGNLDNLPDTIQAALDLHTFRINAHIDSITADGETHAAGKTGNVTVTGSKSNVIHAAEGGVFQATPGGVDVNLAEGGRDEAVVPLNPDGSIPGANNGTTIVNITMPVGTNGADVVRAIKQYERRNGPGWRGGPGGISGGTP